MKYFSTFTGIGGLDMGLVELGGECVGFSEIKNTSIQVYKEHYPDHKNYGDITKIEFDKLPDFDVLTGGFPCQTFSLAGARKGFGEHKGQMIFYLFDLLRIKKPKLAVFENVKGILNHNHGKTFQSVVQLLELAGYKVMVLLLNALNYGSAQNRERMIFICTLKEIDKKVPQILDNTKLFRDIRDNGSKFEFIKKTEFNQKKIEQKRQFSFELIGGYDRTGTLTTQYGCGEKLVWEDSANDYRYLTPNECERLQGFPDDWTAVVRNSARYFALGNAVNCDMSRYIFKNYLNLDKILQ